MPAAAPGSQYRGDGGQKISPIAHASREIARSASSSEVIPQNLILVTPTIVGRPRSLEWSAAPGGGASAHGELAARRLDVGRAHQRLPDQHRVESRLDELVELAR